MYKIRTEAHFDAAHFLWNYEGKCRNIHGHRWRITAEISADDVQSGGTEDGMVIDFGDLKRLLKAEADKLDHSLIYEKGSLSDKLLSALNEENFALNGVDFRPTAENFAKYFYRRLTVSGYNVSSVTVYETPENCAVYEE